MRTRRDGSASTTDRAVERSSRQRTEAAWAGVLLALTIGSGACTAPEPEAEIELSPAPFETADIRVNTGKPRLTAETIEFVAGVAESARFEIGSADQLEFVPVVIKPGTQAPPEVRTAIVVEGDEIVLSTDPPLRRVALQGPDGVRRLLDPVRIDLSGYRGRNAHIVWRLATDPAASDDPTAGPRIGIAGPRLLPTSVPDRPDVLLICSDTHRYDYALGPESAGLMPNLQRLMDESVVYARSYSTASWTMPSIATALTGLYSRYHGVGRLAGTTPLEEFDPSAVPIGQFAFKAGGKIRFLSTYSDAIESLPETLRRVGYTSVIVAGNPLYFLSGLAFDGTDLAVDSAVSRSDEINAAAFAALETAAPDRPLLLLVHYMDVHHWKQWYLAEGVTPRSDNYREAVLESYRDGAVSTDEAIGRLLERWRKVRGPGAAVVFYADHGEHLLDPHDPQRLGHGNTMDDVLLHVPLSIRYPDGVGPAPGVVDLDTSLVDIAPTLLDALDVAGPETDAYHQGYGRSLLATDDTTTRVLYSDFQLYGAELSSVRTGDAKMILHFEEDRTELVNARTGEALDPDAHEEAARGLLRAFRQYEDAAELHRESLVFDREIDQEEAMRNLEALGYVN